ncbi:hypothetical protein Glove_346g186 [Diversispora epigaea]|uniref:Protein kinase domain-containing protein n=1 Tax=Diversispora epigaea TaxID=1348612 RepID=A0A397HJW1_9GLOM|nr:hypothetical protein Glove_346g186 [Diversispora epigaea]
MNLLPVWEFFRELLNRTIFGLKPKSSKLIFICKMTESFTSRGYDIGCLKCNKKCITNMQLCKRCFAMNSLVVDSGNVNIDNFIKTTQSSINEVNNDPFLEWVPFEKFTNVECIGKGSFSQIYKATWEKSIGINDEGIIERSKTEVVLKILNNSQGVDTEILKELKYTYQFRNGWGYIIKCYGVTQDPQTKNYAFILEYIKDGDLHHFIYKNFEKFTWIKKFIYLDSIIKGIKEIHDKKIIHGDLHSGNILVNNYHTIISDLGFCQPATIDSDLSRKSPMYGLIPFMAPELFKNQPFSYASDIYNLGMIMWQMTSGYRPFHDQEHGPKLIVDILDGKRPEITEDTPECWANLMKKCWHPDPSQRSTILEIYELSRKFEEYYKNYYYSEDYFKQYYPDQYDSWLELKEAEKKRLEMIESKKPFVKNPGYEHLDSRYYSRSLNSMIESINSKVSDLFSNSHLLSNDRFDIMNFNSNQKNDLENSDHNSSAEISKKHFLNELLEEEEINDRNDLKRKKIAEYFDECN